jgi:ferredoxin
MLFDYLTRTAGKVRPCFHRSRCLRMRHRNNGCDLCLRECPKGALDFSREAPLDQEKCNSCFRCTAVCPTEALSCGEFDFEQFLRQVRSAGSAPVIGCASSRAGIHPAIPCIGLLSDAHLAVLALSQEEIGIDTTPCAACTNGEMAQVLQERLAHLSPILNGRIRLGAYPHRDLPKTSRRDFFSTLRTGFAREVATAISAKDKPVSLAYSEKQLPLERKLLNEILKTAAERESGWLKKALYFAVEVDEGCTLCTACSAFCPTGSLKRKKEEGWTLQFRSASCPGCGLCTDSCRHSAIRVRAADPETDVFAWRTLRRENQPDRQDEIPGPLGRTGAAGRE